MAKDKAIITRGTADDRLRLAAIARQEQRSGNDVVLGLIRERYEALFGDLPPAATAAQTPE